MFSEYTDFYTTHSLADDDPNLTQINGVDDAELRDWRHSGSPRSSVANEVGLGIVCHHPREREEEWRAYAHSRPANGLVRSPFIFKCARADWWLQRK